MNPSLLSVMGEIEKADWAFGEQPIEGKDNSNPRTGDLMVERGDLLYWQLLVSIQRCQGLNLDPYS